MNNLYNKLTENTREELELYAVEYPASAKYLIKALKSYEFFVDMKWGDVEDLCVICYTNSPYELLKV